MASSIDTTTIDANYPVAGIDNDSQGFRDNFNSIKTNITTAGSYPSIFMLGYLFCKWLNIAPLPQP